MSKSVNAFLGAMVGAAALVGVASGAQAHHWHGCSSCGPQPTRYVYKDVTHSSEVYHHENKYHRYPVYTPRLTVYVTRIHPVVHVHNLITIHEQPYQVIVNHSKFETVTEGAHYTYSSHTTVVHEPCVCCRK